jgi:hypothetical protein
VLEKVAWSGSVCLTSLTVSLGALAQEPAAGEPVPAYPPAEQQGYPPPGYPQQGYPPPQQEGYYAAPEPGGYSPEADRPGDVREGRHEAAHEFRSISIEVNPLGLFIGHYSVNVEWMPAQHHALVANPHFDSVSADVTIYSGTEVVEVEDHFSGGGVELGYRFYTGRRGPNGFFVGPSLLLAAYSASHSDITGSDAKTFTRVGFAIDVGGQAVLSSGFVIGGGFGMQRTWVDGEDDYRGDLPLSAEVLVGGGIRPRFLFAMGYAF